MESLVMREHMNKHVILGYGEVGKVIELNVRGKVYHFDKGEWENSDASESLGPDILHICIPYSLEFIDTTIQAIDIFMPKFVVIHSSVPDGTCDNINEDVLYSPVIGRHQDDFSYSSRHFAKYIAGKRELYDGVADMFEYIVDYWGPNRAELEYAKIMSTSYMYWCLVYEKTIHRECKERGYDPAKVYKRWNRNYNDGYSEMYPEWMRPIYDHFDDRKPGGHCLSPNIEMTNCFVNDILKKWENPPNKK